MIDKGKKINDNGNCELEIKKRKREMWLTKTRRSVYTIIGSKNVVIGCWDRLVGKYRKHHNHNKESFFTGETELPIFEKNGIKNSIIICYGSRFPESAKSLTQQGAQVIFCPLNNSLPHAKADEWRDRHIRYLTAKALMSGCWIVSADVVEKSEYKTGYG